MSDRLVDVEGVGPAFAAKLAEQGLTTTDDLLARGGRPADRASLAAATGIDAALILEWVNHADLFRIRGVAGQFADLLEEAGVDTVVELARRNPGNLATALATANTAKNLANRVPSLSEVEDWVAQAAALPRAVFYDDAGGAMAAAGSGSATSTAVATPPAPVAAPAPPRAAQASSATGSSSAAATLVDRGSGDGRSWLDRLMDRIRGR
jgi:predicted flap endonuclease-1-like 5' DNA nuclease